MKKLDTEVQIGNRTFVKYIPASEIELIIERLATEINESYRDYKIDVVLISILDGSFVFMADLVRKLDFLHHIQFVKLKSYEGTESTGTVTELLDIEMDITGKHVIIIEDIIDTGLTIEAFLDILKKKEPLSVKVCTLLSKPEVHNDIIDINYIGKEVPPEFIVGYGLDLNGLGRNLPDIYKLKI